MDSAGQVLERSHLDATPPKVALVANTLWYLLTFRRPTIIALRARGAHVLCVGQRGPAATGLRELGCEVLELDWRLDSMNPVHELAIVVQLTNVLRRHRTRLLFSFTIKANLCASIACRVLHIPYCTNVSGLGTAFLRDGIAYRGARQLFGVANAGAHTSFFQNNTDVALFESLGLSRGKRTIVLPGSGVDVRHFAYRPPRPSVRTFLMIARLIRDKGVIEYLEAARALAQKDTSLRFALVGPSGVQNAGSLTVADIGGFGVEYLGELDDVRDAIASSDCVVLPSYREGMPKVVLEAASIGRMAVVTDVPGCRDAIEPGVTGLLCEARSSVSLAAAMQTAASLDSAKVMAFSRAARLRAERVFSVERCTQPYMDIVDAHFGAAQ